MKTESKNLRKGLFLGPGDSHLTRPPEIWFVTDWTATLRELKDDPDHVHFESLALALRASEPVPPEVRAYLTNMIATGKITKGRGRPRKDGGTLAAIASVLQSGGEITSMMRAELAECFMSGRATRKLKGRPPVGNIIDREIENGRVISEFAFQHALIYWQRTGPDRLGSPFEVALEETQKALEKDGIQMSAENIRRILIEHRPPQRPGPPEDPFWEPKPHKQ